MAKASIPVDLFNPGQVFACMGFLEAADVLLGKAEGGFDWAQEAEARFEVRVDCNADPFRTVLEFLTTAELQRLAPEGYTDPPASNDAKKRRRKGKERLTEDEAKEQTGDGPVRKVETFPAPKADRSTLPLRFERDSHRLDVTHWCDASSRNPFKLFAGQQRSAAIAQQMLFALRELWNRRSEELMRDPLGLSVPLGGSSFKLDARKSWTAIDAGYSPDEQTHGVEASPVVEMLAAVGLEHARPDEFETREVRYGVWKGLLPPVLARPALGGVRVGVPMRVFRFTLDLAGKNKIVTFAREETTP
jgi:CRISPR-associated protein Csx14